MQFTLFIMLEIYASLQRGLKSLIWWKNKQKPHKCTHYKQFIWKMMLTVGGFKSLYSSDVTCMHLWETMKSEFSDEGCICRKYFTNLYFYLDTFRTLFFNLLISMWLESKLEWCIIWYGDTPCTYIRTILMYYCNKTLQPSENHLALIIKFIT